jgi:hypothetical protein
MFPMLPQKTGVSGEHDKMTPRRMQATIGAENAISSPNDRRRRWDGVRQLEIEDAGPGRFFVTSSKPRPLALGLAAKYW